MRTRQKKNTFQSSLTFVVYFIQIHTLILNRQVIVRRPENFYFKPLVCTKFLNGWAIIYINEFLYGTLW